MQSKESAQQPSLSPQQRHHQQQLHREYNSPGVYQHMGPQFMNSQPMYYPTGPVMNAPPTPFDTAYGVTLLPSHLLMGSPFVSSPNLFQQPHHHQHAHQRLQQYSHNQSKSSSGRSFGKLATAYPVPPSLNSPPASRNALHNRGPRRGSHYKSIQSSDASKRFKDPFILTYRVLPRGNDEFRTRSLLFENVDGSIDLHSFVTNYTNYGPVESVYLFTSEGDHVSILLSFFSKAICLDFYNSVLQRLSEYKSDLDSKALTLSFVSLEYKVSDTSEEDIDKEDGSKPDAFNITAAGSLRYDVINRGATRSIMITFKTPCSKEELIDKKLEFLKKENNTRYVLESIDLVTADEPSKHFPQNYAVLTFLNIFMAVEILDYIRLHSQKLDISKCFFISIQPQIPDGKRLSVSSASNGRSMESINGNYRSKNASVTSLESSGSIISLDQEIDEMTYKLQSVNSKKNILEVTTNNYKDPSFEGHTDHLANVTVSEAASLDSQLTMPSPQEVTVNEYVLPNQDVPLPNDINYAPSAQDVDAVPPSMVPMSTMPNTPYGCYMPPPSVRQNGNMTKPITQSLQRQYATSAEVASSMGGGIGNRTVYIGNIHPRSRTEDICNVVRGGILQNVKFLAEKRICFVTFVEASAAVQFYTNAFIDPIVLHGNMLKVGWGHHSGPLPKSIALAVTVGASRNVYVSLPEFAFKDKYINDPQYEEYNKKFRLPDEQQLRDDFSHYGDIEQINYLNDGHCCWVNFTNISAAIKLVEEVKYEDGGNFYKMLGGRYDGLVIGYGKDRCGNVNKNFIAGKNSRFYKKVKKPSFNIRLSKMEEERRQHEETLRRQQENNSEKFLQFGSLGITIDSNGKEDSEKVDDVDFEEEIEFDSNSPKKTVEQASGKESDQEEQELLKLSNKSQGAQGLNIVESQDQSTREKEATKLSRNHSENDETSAKSDASSDVELIINSPEEEESNFKSKSNRGFKKNDRRKLANGAEGASSKERCKSTTNDVTSALSSSSLEANPPMAPATISRNYSLMFKQQYNHEKLRDFEGESFDDESQQESNFDFESTQQTRRRRYPNRRHGKSIPGSDVMAQYLAQLQHSTFIYAANILGASNDGDNNYLDENADS